MSFRPSRRGFLEIVGLGAGVVALRSLYAPSRALADVGTGQLLLSVYFQGGWDQLLALDPRPYDQPAYQDNDGANKVYPGYQLVTDPNVKAVLASAAGKSGVQTAGNLTFGPAVPPSLLAHHADLCIVRGLMMDTLTHEVGRRYFITGKFPRGLAPNGSALGTMAASLLGGAAILPNLAVTVESYNEGQPAYASPIRVNRADDVFKVLNPLGQELDPKSDAALAAFEEASATCEHAEYDATGMVGLFKQSREKARAIVDSSQAALFAYDFDQPPPGDLFSKLGIGGPAELAGPKGRAAIAALALEHGVSQAVSLQLADDLDDHADWDLNHGTSLWNGFGTLGDLIGYLKQADYKGPGGGKVWDRTTLLCFSEFARGPRVNSRNGRDHHLASSCLLAGPGVKGDLVVGGTSDNNMEVRKMNLSTGAPDDASGELVRPADIHATLLTAMGLGYDHLSNQSPKLLDAVLDG